MSAFIVDKRHIDGMVSSALAAGRRYGGSKFSWRHDGETHYLDHSNADTVGSMLWAENVASVEHRYSPPGREAIYGEGFGECETGSGLPGSYQLELVAPGVEPIEVPQWLSTYRYDVVGAPVLSAVAALKAIDCYEYQSCEHDEWEESSAFAFCDSLRRSLIGQLPGYDAAAWSLR